MKDSKLRYLIFVLLFSVAVFTFLKIFPPFKSSAGSADVVLVDLMLDKNTINTEESEDQLIVYVRATTSNPEGYIWIDAQIGPDTVGYDEDYPYTEDQVKDLNFELMTSGCDSLEGLNTEGLEGTCGDWADGVFMATVDFLQYSSINDWYIYSFAISDSSFEGEDVNNVPISFTAGTITTQEGERNIKVVNEAVTEDTEAPIIVDYAFDKDSIDTTDHAETLTMYLRVRDGLVGVSEEFEPQIIFIPENEAGFQGSTESTMFEFSLMTEGCDTLPESLDLGGLTGCGDRKDGIYEATVEIPRFSTGGSWDSRETYVHDVFLNSAIPGAFEASFLNTSIEYDTELPVLKSVSITPASFDTAEGSQIVTIELEIEDDMSGIDYLGDWGIEVGIWSIASRSESYYNGPSVLVEGTIYDGKFVTEVEMPQGITKGFWRVYHIDIMDMIGRERRYTTADLSLAFPDLPLYLVNQGTTEQVELLDGWVLEDWPYYQDDQVVWPDISIRFPEGTVITKEEGGVFAFHRMLATKYDLALSTDVNHLLDGVNSDYEDDLLECDPVEGCLATDINGNNLLGTPLHVIKMGIPGLNLTFSKPVTIVVGMDEQYLGSTFTIQTFDEDQGVWIEHGTCVVEIVEPGSMDAGGDNFGEVIPAAYPGCSFTTTHASFFSVGVLGLAGVPNTGIGGSYAVLSQYFEWL